VAPPGYLLAAQELVHAHGALLIADEVQTGIARTGKFLAIEWDEGVAPDIITVAKALSGGIAPVAAVLCRKGIFEKVYSSLEKVLVHDSTFSGNALAMTAGLATLSVIDDEGLIANAERRGEQLREGIREVMANNDLIVDVRGRGLMIGIEFGKPSSLGARSLWSLLNTAHKGLFAQIVVVPLHNRRRVLTQVAGDRMPTIKLLPPLIIGDEEVDYFLEAFRDVMADARKPNGLTIEFGKTLIKNLARRDA
jgi:ornithine--oxo-acid transaminase